MLINLLYISLIVALVFESGFWESMDDYVNEKFKFLPHRRNLGGYLRGFLCFSTCTGLKVSSPAFQFAEILVFLQFANC